MNKATRKALERSIAHWERVVEFGGRYTRDNISSDNCALCRRFNSNECEGCPVKERTGQSICKGSPYHEAARLWYVCRGEGLIPCTQAKFKRAARRELAFLKSLLPQE